MQYTKMDYAKQFGVGVGLAVCSFGILSLASCSSEPEDNYFSDPGPVAISTESAAETPTTNVLPKTSAKSDKKTSAKASQRDAEITKRPKTNNATSESQYLSKTRSDETGVSDDDLLSVGYEVCIQLKERADGAPNAAPTLAVDDDDHWVTSRMDIQQRVNVGAYAAHYLCPEYRDAYADSMGEY